MQAAEHRPTVKLVNTVQWFTQPVVNITGDQSPETVLTFACFDRFKYVIILISSNQQNPLLKKVIRLNGRHLNVTYKL